MELSHAGRTCTADTFRCAVFPALFIIRGPAETCQQESPALPGFRCTPEMRTLYDHI